MLFIRKGFMAKSQTCKDMHINHMGINQSPYTITYICVTLSHNELPGQQL